MHAASHTACTTCDFKKNVCSTQTWKSLRQYADCAQHVMNSFVTHRWGLSFINCLIGLYRLRDGTNALSKEITGGVV
ncbi:hypothetical protein PHMEG_0007904 [Phytophthora megakarya]|uniref:Uncharacterized protein n=1 Tax=Phytophthora megakarya TaxID=4795 RepID=A0A225WKJ0_9STRA|nr:hypothetical protein PHMEG_0007904 [Phytophthora megakarya]